MGGYPQQMPMSTAPMPMMGAPMPVMSGYGYPYPYPPQPAAQPTMMMGPVGGTHIFLSAVSYHI